MLHACFRSRSRSGSYGLRRAASVVEMQQRQLLRARDKSSTCHSMSDTNKCGLRSLKCCTSSVPAEHAYTKRNGTRMFELCVQSWLRSTSLSFVRPYDAQSLGFPVEVVLLRLSCTQLLQRARSLLLPFCLRYPHIMFVGHLREVSICL